MFFFVFFRGAGRSVDRRMDGYNVMFTAAVQYLHIYRDIYVLSRLGWGVDFMSLLSLAFWAARSSSVCPYVSTALVYRRWSVLRRLAAVCSPVPAPLPWSLPTTAVSFCVSSVFLFVLLFHERTLL